MKTWREATRDALVSGSVASAISTVALVLCARAEGKTAVSPTNATSHWLWGERAARQDSPSLRYTLVGYATHHASAVFWAVLYEKLFGHGADRRQVARALQGGIAIAALSAVVDYGLMPKRLTPGFEDRLSKPSMFVVFTALAVGLGVGALLRRPQGRN